MWGGLWPCVVPVKRTCHFCTQSGWSFFVDIIPLSFTFLCWYNWPAPRFFKVKVFKPFPPLRKEIKNCPGVKKVSAWRIGFRRPLKNILSQDKNSKKNEKKHMVRFTFLLCKYYYFNLEKSKQASGRLVRHKIIFLKFETGAESELAKKPTFLKRMLK